MAPRHGGTTAEKYKALPLMPDDARPYEVQLEQANAQFQTASATVALANKQLDRSARLNRVAVESDERLDETTQSQRVAAAAVKAAEAAIHAAQLNIEFTHIVAPFSGRVSRRHVSIGSLITGGPGATSATELTTIVSLDPIYLDFDLSEADYAAYQHSVAARPSGANPVQISLDGERPWARTGDLDFLDNEIDRRSGTLHARATLANPDLAIAPGAFARVRVPLSATLPQLLVPDAAVGTDQSSKLVMVIVVAIVLVVLVVILFLQTWRASIIPIAAIPVSLIGTLAVLVLLF